MKKISAVAAAIIFAVAAAWFSSAAFADKNIPPDESVSGRGEDEAVRTAREKREAEERAAREARAAAARRAREQAEAEARKKAEERRAVEAEEALRVASEDAANQMMRTGVTHVAEGRYKIGIGVMRAYLAGHPRSAEAWYWISLAHHSLGDYDRAQAAANIALEIDPAYAPLTKTPSGLEPVPPRDKNRSREPRPSMSVLPVTPLLPSGIPLAPLTLSFPYLASERGKAGLPDEPLLRYDPYAPLEPGVTAELAAVRAKFSEIGRWRFRVDRMGILTEPRVPVAWRGDRPYEVYFWTGREWARIARLLEGEPFYEILRRSASGMAEVASKEGFSWDERDTPALAAAASHMRYKWFGDVDAAELASRAERDESGRLEREEAQRRAREK
jgi:hypothetical protein